MQDTITRYMIGVSDPLARNAMYYVINPIADRIICKNMTTAGLVITGAGGTTAKIGAVDYYAWAKSVQVRKAAATAMPALSGSTATTLFNFYAFFMDASGTVTSAMGTAGATLGAAKFPPIPQGQTVVGYIIINPTGTGPFIGGTTALDDATVVPNAVFISPLGSFDPSIVL